MNILKIERNTRIFLYGSNEKSKVSYEKMKLEGYNIQEIIDQKSDLISILDQDSVVIICLNDGIKHDKIAEKIHSFGVGYILFLPMCNNYSLRSQSISRRSYINFINGEYENIFIPKYEDINEKDKMFRIIEKTKKNVFFMCPYDLLYVMDKEIYQTKENGSTIMERYIDCHIGEFELYLDLFYKIMGKKENCDKYLEYQRTNDIEKLLLMENRRKLFEIYEEKYYNDKNFFYDSPAIVKINSFNKLTILDGLHRVCYLYIKGEKEYPVVLGREEFKRLKSI